MNVLDLFSGIGGFSLGLERAGMRTVAFCEIDPYCRAVLRKHWPEQEYFGNRRKIYEDVRFLTGTMLAADGIQPIDLICGGFPCQDISIAGKGAGITGERSSLWGEYARLIGELRPSYAIVENVAALLGRGIERVLGDLAALRYDAEWYCLRAARIGLPHSRDRIWIVAYPEGRIGRPTTSNDSHLPYLGRGILALLSTAGSHAFSARQFREEVRAAEFVGTINGIPNRVDRIASLGNAVVPQIPEIIGRAIMKAAA